MTLQVMEHFATGMQPKEPVLRIKIALDFHK